MLRERAGGPAAGAPLPPARERALRRRTRRRRRRPRGRRRRRTDPDRARRPAARHGAPRPAERQSSATCSRRLVEAGGLAIEIARLRVELRRQLAEVEASRARIVAAGDEERRRIERDLHDGAQQRLVSIGLALRHAQHELGVGVAGARRPRPSTARSPRSPSRSTSCASSRAACRPPSSTPGSRPPCASSPAGARCPSRSTRRASASPPSVETAAYFIACEGLTNAVKHAHATKIVLERGAATNGSLVVSVADDGVGGRRPRARVGPERASPTASPPTAARCGSKAAPAPARR